MSIFIQIYRKPICLRKENVLVLNLIRARHATNRNKMFDINILKDLSCKHFKATTFEFPPVITMKKHDNGMLEYGGYETMVFDNIASKLNFRYTISPPKTGIMWGAHDNNGNYTGLLGDLYNDWCDVGWANFWDRESHRSTADLTYPHLFDSACFIVSVNLSNST